MSPRGYHTVTLGCKLNQFDTAAIEGELRQRGFRAEVDPGQAAVVIVNSCTVTAQADADVRKRIRQLRRRSPDCTLLVTGCYAERDAEAIRRLPGVDHVIGNREKATIGRVLDHLFAGAPAVVGGDRGCDASLELPPALHFGDRSRAFLKVQEGCRLACSYCVIPAVRGPSRSVLPASVVAAARSLFASGYREIVLTGVNVGDYGRDLDPPSSLAVLLRRLLADCGPNRIRLNSLEPRTVTDEIVELMAREPRLAPHLQVPLQSGSDEILRRMRRNYGVDTYLERLNRLRTAVPHAGLGADVIVGFPGEDDVRFRQTYDLIASSPINYLHVFSWSPRPGTAAADYPERVAVEQVKERSRALRTLGEERSLRFRQGFVGRSFDAVVLGRRRSDGSLRALTGNFIEVALDPRSAARGDIVRARLTRATPDETTAVVTGAPLS